MGSSLSEAPRTSDASGTTFRCIELVATARPHALALTFHPDGMADEAVVSWTYDQFLRDVRRAANGLAALGVRRNDVVAIILPALAETHIALWGAEAAGVAAMLSPMLEPMHLANLLKQIRPTVVVCQAAEANPSGHGKVRTALERAGIDPFLVVVGGPASEAGNKEKKWTEWLDEQIDNSWNVDPCSEDDLCALFHTGGTTGAPKVARHTHRMQVSNALAVAKSGDVRPSDVMLSATPLFHVSGIIIGGLAPFSVGAHVVILTKDGFRNSNIARQFWKIVERWKATTFNVVPTILGVLAEQPLNGADISSLRNGACGAAPLSQDLQQRITAHIGRPIVQGYGCTEATCAVTISSPDDIHRQASVGRPIEGVSVIVAEVRDGEMVTGPLTRKTGSVLVRGPNVFPGYLDAAQSAAAFVGEGWLDTGDLGWMDEEGYLWLAGRAKDLIIRGGHNIDPATIEEALLAHPDVVAASAVGQPDSHAGELPCAFVSLRAGSRTTPEMLLAFAADRLPERAASPVNVEILPAMPLTPVGKIFKPALRLKAAERVFNAVLAQHALDASVTTCLTEAGIAVAVEAADDLQLQAARKAFAGFSVKFSFELASRRSA